MLSSSYSPRLDSSGRLADPWRFRRRRLRQIGVPYLCWTSIYLGLAIAHQPSTASPVGALAGRWLGAALTGTGWYHLYFLLVTLQLALVSPPLLWLLHRTRGHHGRVLAVSLGVQLVTLGVYWAGGVPGGAWTGVIGEASLPAYQFWLITGAIAGIHLPRWHRWLLRHRLALLAAVPPAGAALLATYFAQLTGRGPIGASSPLQPIMLVWALAVLAALYVLAVTLTTHRTPLLVRWARAGAHLSFGVYLAHPLILDLVLATFTRLGLLAPSRWMSLAALALTTTISFTGCALLRRTRASPALIGRPTAATRVSPPAITGGGPNLTSTPIGR
jgi:peptidoglycan/LPS O-acetylase OafA/YrhL